MSDYRIVTGRRKQLEERIAELDTENKRLKNRGTITSPMDGLFEENERLEAKLDAAHNWVLNTCPEEYNQFVKELGEAK